MRPKTFFFGDHQISIGNTVKISVKVFFFGDHIIIRTQTAAFSPSVLEFTKPEIRNICAGPGPHVRLSGSMAVPPR